MGSHEEQFPGDGLIFYRCCLCRRVVNVWDLRKHQGCGYCGHAKISPCNLTWWEKLIQIVKHPKVWEWGNARVGN